MGQGQDGRPHVTVLSAYCLEGWASVGINRCGKDCLSAAEAKFTYLAILPQAGPVITLLLVLSPDL